MERISLAEGFELHQLDLKARRCTYSTQQTYRWYLRPFIQWCKGQRLSHLHEITSTHVKRYVVVLQERDLSGHTQRGAASSIRAWLKFCEREEMIFKAPKVTMPDVDEEILPAYSADDIKKLWAAAKTPLERTVMLVLLDSGVRAFELIALDGGDIDLATGEIQVRKGKGEKAQQAERGRHLTQGEFATLLNACLDGTNAGVPSSQESWLKNECSLAKRGTMHERAAKRTCSR